MSNTSAIRNFWEKLKSILFGIFMLFALYVLFRIFFSGNDEPKEKYYFSEIGIPIEGNASIDEKMNFAEGFVNAMLSEGLVDKISAERQYPSKEVINQGLELKSKYLKLMPIGKENSEHVHIICRFSIPDPNFNPKNITNICERLIRAKLEQI